MPEEFLFTSVPLAARLTTGVTNIKELALKQRENITNKAASNSYTAPETRFWDFSNSGELKMAFTQPLEIPEGTEELIRA